MLLIAVAGVFVFFYSNDETRRVNSAANASTALAREWARRSRLHEFVALARTSKRFQQLIWNTLHKHGVSNARSEATNTHIRALTKRAYGYHSPEALIAMAMLTRGGLKLELPGRK